MLSYLTGIGYADPDREEEFEKFWPMQYHFVGKDIIRFHCVIWPAMLMAAGLPQPKCIFGHGFLLTKGEKMSKSKGNAVMPDDIIKVFGLDAYRYYFMSDVQFGADGSISLERMVQVYNADLANTWGNLCSRVLNMTNKYFEGNVPKPTADMENPMLPIVEGLYKKYDECMERVDFTGATKAAMELCERVNHYVEEVEPWNLAKSEDTKDQLATVLYNMLESIRIAAIYLSPFMPETSQEVFLGLGLGKITDIEDIQAATKWGRLEPGKVITMLKPLFPRLNEEEIDFSID